jgi:argininosuccinate synthase
VRDYCFKALAAGRLYEEAYLLGTSLARPILAHGQVKCALREGADALAHGATGKGNDQVRFEVTYATFAPNLKVIAPWREWNIARARTRCSTRPRTTSRSSRRLKDIFSRDGNLWHLSHEGGNLEDPWDPPQKPMFKLTVDPQDAPNEPQVVTLASRRADRSRWTASGSARWRWSRH